LTVWGKAHQYVLAVHQFTSAFPKSELYGLTQQMRQAAVSIPANIAEGLKRRGKFGKVRFINIAEGSPEETRYYLLLAADLGYGQSNKLMKLAEEVSPAIGRLFRCYSIFPLLTPSGF
jgi:four helix bundle protein